MHSLLSNTNSSVILQSFKSIFTDSSHAKFGLPMPLFPLSVRLITLLQIDAFGGLHWIYQNYLKRCWTSFSLPAVTYNLLCMSSFQTRSLLVWPQINYRMCISATLSCRICYILVGQHSASYNKTCHITVLQNLPFSLYDPLGSHKTPEAWCHFN
jgi:hypothetical protein